MRTLETHTPRHNLILLPCDTKWDFCVWAATEGHMKRWRLYNRWCQIGCQLQHKWRSISSSPHVKRPLYRRLDFRQHKKSLLPAHSTALQEGLQKHAHRGLHSCIHSQSKQIHTWCSPIPLSTFIHKQGQRNVLKTHTRSFALHPTHNSFFRKHITDRALGLLQALTHTQLAQTRAHTFIFFLRVHSSSLHCSHS